MGFLDNFEKGLERAINGAFSKTFKSELQPVEIASAIRVEMDAKSSIVSRDRILAPNSFLVRLASPDFNRMASLGQALIEELTEIVTKHAKRQNYQFGAAVAIKLQEDGSLPIGQVQVASQSQQLQVEWQPALEFAGQQVLLTKPRTTVGRDSSADIQVNDAGLSRQHFEVVWNGKQAGVRDLQSTNGTRLDGRPVKESGMLADSVITAGATQFVFRVIAKSVGNV